MRVLVSGSRVKDGAPEYMHDVWKQLTDLCVVWTLESEDENEKFIVVEGACLTGADDYAHQWTLLFEDDPYVVSERHPADWAKYGRSAGPKRNKLMVDLGADIVLVFIRDGSRGAAGTADLAEKAGLDVRRFEV